MKKTLLIVMTVAILGGLGVYIDKGSGDTPSAANNVVSTTDTPATSSSSSQSSTSYKNGTFIGSQENAVYGTVQVAAVVSGGKIVNIDFLQMPSDQQNSKVITSMAEPQLKQESLQAQSAHIDFVSGATLTSQAFEQSLQDALDQALA